MRTFLLLPVTTVIGRCTLDLPQMTVLDLRKAHDRFLLANPRATSTDGMIGHISSVWESVGDSEALLRDSGVLI